MNATSDARTRLRMAGQADLGAWVEAATGTGLWSVQRRIASASSKYRARVSVPSCVASGKTHLAGRLALAFYDSFTPGTPCTQCGGPCGGAKVITIASKFEHLRDVLWGEIRSAYTLLADRGLAPEGTMSRGQNLRLQSDPGHYLIGVSPHQPEGLQGIHGPHVFVIGDEATAVSEEVTKGLGSTLATGDARLLLIFNPTTPDTWAYQVTQAPATEVIKITAWDTPHFTGETPAPSGLLTPEYLEELQGMGGGSGSFVWTTKIQADFWELGDTLLIPAELFDGSADVPHVPGTRALGIDLAPYGDDLNVIAFRDGNGLVKLSSFPSMRQDMFWRGPVLDAVRSFAPDYLIWDADGVGAGVYGEAEYVQSKFNQNGGNLVLMPFRGGVHVTAKFTNARAAWWWSLRQRFENGGFSLQVKDDRLRSELTGIRYSVTDAGDIRVETKGEMRKRNMKSPNFADAVTYSFSMVEELPTPARVEHSPLSDWAGVRDHSPDAMWRRNRELLKTRGQEQSRTPSSRLAQGQLAWDDI